MMFLSKLSESWICNAIGWSLLHFLWQGMAVAFLLWCALRGFAKSPAQIRYLLACAALGITMLLPVATFVHAASVHRALSEHRRIPAAVGAVGEENPLDDSSAWAVRLKEGLDEATPWIFPVWLTGAVLFLGRFQASVLMVGWMRASRTWPVEAELTLLFEAAQRRLAVSRPVQLLHSAFVQAPAVAGWMRPVILVPAGSLSGLSPEQIEAILCHELAHIRRHDYLVGLLQSIVEGLLFYHPAVWWISRQARLERECCCDELVVSTGTDTLVYARALTSLAAAQFSYPEFTPAANGGVLTMRIKRLLGCKTDGIESRAGALVILFMIVFGAVAAGRFARAEFHDSKEPALVSSSPLPSRMTLQTESVAVRPSFTKPEVRVEAKPFVEPRTRIVASSAHPIFSSNEPVALAAAPETADLRLAEVPIDFEVPPAKEPTQVPSGVIAGNKLSGVTPHYPEEARAKHIQGAVVLNAVISEEGAVEHLTVASGPEELRSSAVEVVRQWRYKPYLVNGAPVEVKTTITVNYHIGN